MVGFIEITVQGEQSFIMGGKLLGERRLSDSELPFNMRTSRSVASLTKTRHSGVALTSFELWHHNSINRMMETDQRQQVDALNCRTVPF